MFALGYGGKSGSGYSNPNVLVPGSIARMQALMQATAAANSGMVFYSNSIFWLGIVIGMLATCIPLWFLVTLRRAFLDACKSP